MVDGFREGRARQPEASMTGDGCCAADLAVRLPRIRQPGILIHHALLSILRIEVPVSGSGSVVEVSMYRRMTVRLSQSVGSRTLTMVGKARVRRRRLRHEPDGGIHSVHWVLFTGVELEAGGWSGVKKILLTGWWLEADAGAVRDAAEQSDCFRSQGRCVGLRLASA